MTIQTQDHIDTAESTTQQASADTAVQPAIAEPGNADQGTQQQEGDREGHNEGEQQQRKELTPAEKEARALRRRVDRLTRDKYQREARERQLEEELQRYRAQLGGQEGTQQQDQNLGPEAVQAQARQLVEAERFNSRCDEVVQRGTETYPDFAAKVQELAAEAPLFDRKGRPEPILEAILDADDPPRLIYHLGENPDLAAEIAALPPRQQVRRLALIERDLGAQAQTPAQSKPQAQPKPMPVTKAPAPITPVRGQGGQFSKDPAQMSDAEWWAQQRKKSS